MLDSRNLFIIFAPKNLPNFLFRNKILKQCKSLKPFLNGLFLTFLTYNLNLLREGKIIDALWGKLDKKHAWGNIQN